MNKWIFILSTLITLLAAQTEHPFKKGETLLYDVSLNFFSAGTASLELGDIEEFGGAFSYHITFRMKTNSIWDQIFPIRDTVETWIDSDGLFTRKLKKVIREPRYSQDLQADFDYDLKRENLTITAKLSQQDLGEYESRMIISYNDVEYNMPIIVRVTKATVLVNEDDGVLSFDVSGHPSWSYAKISVTNKETGETFTESITPTKKSELTVYQPGEYWIEANIKEIDGLSSKTLDVYETVKIEKAEKNQSFVNMLNLPEKPLLIITAVMIITVVAGIFIRKY